MTARSASRLALLMLAGASLAACASVKPQYSSRLPSVAPASGGAVAAPSATATAPVGGGIYKVGQPYQVAGIWYVPQEDPAYDQTGTASWYGDEFHMRPTANGEIFDMGRVSAAHTTLPMPSIVEVTNLENGKTLNVRVNDRGPFKDGRVIDLSREGARRLGFEKAGSARVRVRYVGPAPLGGPDAGVRYASATPATPSGPAYLPQPATPVPYAASRGPAYVTPSTPMDEVPGAAARAPAKVAATALPPTQGQPAPTYAPPGPTSGVYRVQAGAFGDPANAQRAASQLTGAGVPVIEPLERDGATLYRVMLQASADEADAWALRDRVAAAGFVDARVIRPF